MRNRRADILEAALDAFSHRGYSATSMTDLRRTTGASTGSLYHHFASKEHVAAALYVDSIDDFQRGFIEALESAAAARRGIEVGVRFHLAWVERHPRRARLLGAELDPAVLPLAREPLEQLNRAFFERVGAWYDGIVADGQAKRLPRDLVYALWLGPAQELSRAWLSGRTRINPIESETALAEGAWDALRTHDSDER